jgi:hypothetical protein
VKVPFLFRCWGAIGLTLAFAVSTLAQETAADFLTQLETAMRAELAQKKPARDLGDRRDRQEATAAGVLMQLRAAVSRTESSQQEESLNQVLLAYDSEPVRVALEKLRLALRAEREARQKAFVARAQATLDQARKAIQDARTAADLDGVLRDLALVQENRDGVSPEVQTLLARARSAREFAIHWQDYLAHVAAGRTTLAEQSLQSASRMTNAEMLPRSEILARMGQFKEEAQTSPFVPLREIIAKTKTLDDLPAAIDALRDKVRPPYDDPACILHNELVHIQTCYAEFKAGMPALLQIRPSLVQNPPHSDALALALPLKLQLMRHVFPRFLRIEQAPAPEESLDQYVERILKLALERCDARLIARIAELQTLVNATYQTPEYSKGLDALLAAQNQDEAGQFAPAVISYERALRVGGDLTPAKPIGARLKAIQAAHPAEYEMGLKIFLAAPDPGPPHMRINQQPATLKIPGIDLKSASPQPSPVQSPQ